MSKKFIGFLGLIIAFGGASAASGMNYYFTGNTNALVVAGVTGLIVGGILWHGKLNFLKGRGSYNPDLEEVKQHFQKEFKPTEQEKKEAVKLLRECFTEKYGFPREWYGASNSRFRILAGDAADKAYNLIFMKGANRAEINEVAAEAIKDYLNDYVAPARIEVCINYLYYPPLTEKDKAKAVLSDIKFKFGSPSYLNGAIIDTDYITKVNDFVFSTVKDYWFDISNSNSDAIANDLHVGIAHAIIMEYWGDHITSFQLEEARQLIFSKLSPNEETIEAEVVSEAGTCNDHRYNVTKEAIGLGVFEQMEQDRKEINEVSEALDKIANDIRTEGLPPGWYYDNGGRLRNEKGRYAKLLQTEVK